MSRRSTELAPHIEKTTIFPSGGKTDHDLRNLVGNYNEAVGRSQPLDEPDH